MGLLTVDVSPLGVVIAGDSQPVELFAQRTEITTVGPKNRDPIRRIYARDFTGFAGYVGTEQVAGMSTGDWITRAVGLSHAAPLADVCGSLAEALSEEWSDSETHLTIFVAGYEAGEPCFRFISNGDVPDGTTDSIPRTFEPVNNLGVSFEAHAERDETLTDFVGRTQPSYRRGVLSAAAIFDQFTNLVGRAMQEHAEIPPLDSIERFAAYVKFRFEFTKRMYDPKYGIGVDPHPPVFGDVHVYSVDPLGMPRAHDKHAGQSRPV